jgi:hypothetical protein
MDTRKESAYIKMSSSDATICVGGRQQRTARRALWSTPSERSILIQPSSVYRAHGALNGLSCRWTGLTGDRQLATAFQERVRLAATSTTNINQQNSDVVG